MRLRHGVFLLFIVVLGTLFGALFWLLDSNDGARWLLARIPHLKVERVSGTLAEGLDIHHLQWSNGSMHFYAHQLQWDLHASHLLWGELDLENLKILDSQLHLPAASKQPTRLNLEWPALPLWTQFIAIRLNSLSLQKLHVWQGQKSSFILTQATSKSLAWQHGNLHIQQLQAGTPEGQLHLSAQIGMEKRSIKTEGMWIPTAAAGKKTQLQWHILWHDMDKNAFGGPVRLQWTQNHATSILRCETRIEAHQITLNAMTIQNPALSKIAKAHWIINLPDNTAGNFTVHGKLEQLLIKDIPPSLPMGALSLAIRLHGNSRQYQGVLSAQGSAEFGGIEGHLKGSNRELAYNYQGNILGATLLPAQLQIQWQPRIKVSGDFRIRTLPIKSIAQQIPGQLSGDLAINATQEGKIIRGHLQLTLLPSQIYQKNLQGKAEVQFSGNQWNLQNADFRGPGIQLTASGNLQQRLSFIVHVADWQGLLPGARGSTNMEGWLAQNRQAWLGRIQAHAQGLGYSGITIHSLKTLATLQAGNQLQARLDLQGVDYGKHQGNIQAEARGPLTGLKWGIHAQADGNHLLLTGLLKHSPVAWRLLLEQTHLQSAQWGDWQLDNPASLSWSAGAMRISPLIVQDNRGSKISAQGLYNPASNLADLNLDIFSLPLDLHDHTDEMSLEGYVNAQVKAQCHGVCHADWHWDFQKTQLHWLADAEHQSADLQQFSGQVQWQPHNLTVHADLKLPQNWGSAQLHLFSPITLALPWRWNQQAPLQGTLKTELGSPFFAALPVGTLKMRAQGQGYVDGEVSGTWAEPKWHGSAQLEGLGLYVPQAGLDLEKVGAKIVANGQEIQITELHATSGTGQISGTGMIHLQPQTRFAMQITGHAFTALNLPQVQAAVSPDLQIDGSLQKIHIGGVIHTNRLRILGTDFNGPKPSSDVVFVKNIKKNHAGPALGVNLKVTLGNDAKVLISGLRANLVGSLDVLMHDGNTPDVQGILRMVDGHYDIYGHSLDFERGSINFHGEASQANLDVLAVRTIKNSDSFAVDNTPVKAGVQVTGTLQVPQVNLYSSPSMSQADILSYLVLGTPSSSLNNQDELLSAAAGTLFSASRAALFGNSLSNSGIDVGVTSNGQQGLSGAMVTLGHYLTPDLYLSVGQSVMGDGTVARLRYRVSKHIELQTESGTQNGANIFYRIDF
ncbi:translocation/assembly module TamB domain-containing protein [Acidithiobacillus montserratensis]|uniref:Translocation/assembly module TamB domain-containing protein n=1 Tax=Acidithiobacillus montserratensis TaxID=2729135 RepID=A0ACD5HEA2_9PROT|nr:translocation/assembly module TamB [Acidithiobacillus montserratensis]